MFFNEFYQKFEYLSTIIKQRYILKTFRISKMNLRTTEVPCIKCSLHVLKPKTIFFKN